MFLFFLKVNVKFFRLALTHSLKKYPFKQISLKSHSTLKHSFVIHINFIQFLTKQFVYLF